MEPQTLGVAILVLDKTKKKVLLGRRLNSYMSGTLGGPGGRLEMHESLINCCKRELLEEAGLKANFFKFLGVVREVREEYNFVHFAYLCVEYEGEPQVMEPDKCESWIWYELDNLPDNILLGHKYSIDLLRDQRVPLRDVIPELLR